MTPTRAELDELTARLRKLEAQFDPYNQWGHEARVLRLEGKLVPYRSQPMSNPPDYGEGK